MKMNSLILISCFVKNQRTILKYLNRDALERVHTESVWYQSTSLDNKLLEGSVFKSFGSL